ncbi:MAG: hypothetical protein C5B58_11585 [Acidobacteria bacterium]|nr:MAG: hypothetical protein C5B58_11585 [Acidobacteriota bacterium]
MRSDVEWLAPSGMVPDGYRGGERLGVVTHVSVSARRQIGWQNPSQSEQNDRAPLRWRLTQSPLQ